MSRQAEGSSLSCRHAHYPASCSHAVAGTRRLSWQENHTTEGNVDSYEGTMAVQRIQTATLQMRPPEADTPSGRWSKSSTGEDVPGANARSANCASKVPSALNSFKLDGRSTNEASRVVASVLPSPGRERRKPPKQPNAAPSGRAQFQHPHHPHPLGSPFVAASGGRVFSGCATAGAEVLPARPRPAVTPHQRALWLAEPAMTVSPRPPDEATGG